MIFTLAATTISAETLLEKALRETIAPPETDYYSPQATYARAQTKISDVQTSSITLNFHMKDLATFPLEIATRVDATNLAVTNSRVSNLTAIAGLKQLERINLANSPVRDLSPVAGLTKLKTLDLRDTEVDDISLLAGLTELEELCLNNMRVAELTPLAWLTKLRILAADHTRITDLEPVTKMMGLTQGSGHNMGVVVGTRSCARVGS